MQRIVECVPNFSEGRDRQVIDSIVEAISTGAEGIKVLNVDPGEATNRTVVTFTGSPEAVCEAAFQGCRKAAELIDMRRHHGAHPRSGAIDVLPLVPVAGITLEECAELARKLAERMWKELGIPCYCYEASAFKSERKNLAVCRAGEYEALEEKMSDPLRKPDFGPETFHADPCMRTEEEKAQWETISRCGASNVGARDFLIAVNFNLNTTSTRRAMAVAFDVREKGRKLREGGNPAGKILKDADGNPIWQPGTLKGCKAIGWFIPEYGIAQVSMNITDINATPLHKAFDEVSRAANERGMRVTGTEIIGLVPKRVLIEAGKYFLHKQKRSSGVSEEELIKIASRSMGLSDLKPFEPKKKVIEYVMEDEEEATQREKLIRMRVKDFAYETASESPAPGGGSVSALMGALGAALATMVANLSAGKRGWDDRWEEFSKWAEKGQEVMGELLRLVDEDTRAFNRIMEAYAMPKSSAEEIAARSAAIEEATLNAAQVPLETMKAAAKVLPIAEAMARDGNPNSASDAGVASLAARAAIKGAALNVKINAESLEDRCLAEKLIKQAEEIEATLK
ncbi:MAG: glutamate formimidoyltransferase [Bacteroidales bacterium]|nr:glutamate formimidoyltransferase [Bacteroidales bacterium]